jgi:hypothetical protein
VTSRHIRPFISLAEKMLQFAKKIRNASFLGLKVAKPFPGLWKRGDRRYVIKEKHSFPRQLSGLD